MPQCSIEFGRHRPAASREKRSSRQGRIEPRACASFKDVDQFCTGPQIKERGSLASGVQDRCLLRANWYDAGNFRQSIVGVFSRQQEYSDSIALPPGPATAGTVCRKNPWEPGIGSADVSAASDRIQSTIRRVCSIVCCGCGAWVLLPQTPVPPAMIFAASRSLAAGSAAYFFPTSRYGARRL